MVPIEGIVSLQGRIGSGSFTLAFDELFIDGVEGNFLVLHIVAGVVQVVEYILHGLGCFALGFEATLFNLLSLTIDRTQVNTIRPCVFSLFF